MEEKWSEEQGLFIKELTFQDWLNGEIIRKHEDGEYEFETGPNGKPVLEKNPGFRRPKISEYIGADDCEYGWIEDDLRSGKKTKFIVSDARELDKVERYLKDQYWSLVGFEFNRLCYTIKQILDASSLSMLINHELDKVNYAFDPSAFEKVPLLVSEAERKERKKIDSISVIYVDFMREGRNCREPRKDLLCVSQHYLVDAYLKYKDWLTSKLEENAEPSNQLIDKTEISYFEVGLVMAYEKQRVTTKKEAQQVAIRFNKSSSTKILSECKSCWEQDIRLEPLEHFNNKRSVRALKRKIENTCANLDGDALNLALTELEKVKQYLRVN